MTKTMSFQELREHYAKSLAKARFHPHNPMPAATKTQIRRISELADKGGVPASYMRLAERGVLDRDEASQTIEAGDRLLARRRRGVKMPFKPCESKESSRRRIQSSIARPGMTLSLF